MAGRSACAVDVSYSTMSDSVRVSSSRTSTVATTATAATMKHERANVNLPAIVMLLRAAMKIWDEARLLQYHFP